ncbi:hypothetical protein Ferp_1992 [Ferroglobus placidus DSM 10642]|uniref:Uncharacterized protein n=1 Tax=Ferroglobus placidus (strain DSM 10642 / AEDII12DO) TaxID=589924 RepID=D3S066_FERPA|nr:hypothetical protein [Ferroglobus placidus]ADC66129.1 hypothetical protein Ferp_1992 [Ferroglobus placidus DSM 10642]
MEEVEVSCPVCRKSHRYKAEIQVVSCKGKPLALVKDRLGWRLMEIRVISEKEDEELDKIWRS